MKTSKIFLCLAVFGFLTAAASALAATGDYVPLVQIPGVNTKDFLQYLSGIYNFLISIVGILAMASLVYGGFRYLTSVGNPAAVEDAKDIINSAIIGLVLALSSWLILNEINPDVLVTNRKPGGGMDALKGLKSAYNPLNRACVANTNLDGALITGTTDKKCRCVDNPDKDVIVKNRTSTKLTLTSPIDGSSAAVGTYVPLAGKLTDANGTPIQNVKPWVYAIYSGADGSGMEVAANPLTDSNGDYLISVSDVATKCAATIKLQAYFEGNPAYAPSSSAPITFTATGTPACAKTNFPEAVKDFSGGGYLCQSACSDPNVAEDKQYHCLKADLRLGTTINPPSGSKNITVKKGQKVYFDARSGSVDYAWPGLNNKVSIYDSGFENGIDAYLYKYNGYGAPETWKNDPLHKDNILKYWSNANFGQYDGTSCTALGAIGTWLADIYKIEAGTGYTSFSTAGDYKFVLNVRSRNGCLGPAVDIGSVHVE